MVKGISKIKTPKELLSDYFVCSSRNGQHVGSGSAVGNVGVHAFRSFRRERTKHDNTRSPPFSYDKKMAADRYWARKALTARELPVNSWWCLV